MKFLTNGYGICIFTANFRSLFIWVEREITRNELFLGGSVGCNSRSTFDMTAMLREN